MTRLAEFLVAIGIVVAMVYVALATTGQAPSIDRRWPGSADQPARVRLLSPAPEGGVPPAGQIWFGAAFDPASRQLTGRVTTATTAQALVVVASLSSPMDGTALVVRTYWRGRLVALRRLPGTGRRDLWVFDASLAAAGTWRYEIVDANGTVRATGSISVT
jgi:hypothetical protein